MATQARNREVTGWVGWIAFAAGMLILGSIFQVIVGLTALFNPHWFATTQQGLLILNFTTWGWVHLILGVVMGYAGVALFNGSVGARAIAAVIAGLSAIANLAYLSVYPIWSLVVITVDILIIYALTVHGDEMRDM
jgi:hypothetical protein